MAPAVCTAQRLPVLFCLLFVIISSSYQNVTALFVYDRQTLFSIRDQYAVWTTTVSYGNQSSDVLSSTLPALPAYLQLTSSTASRRKRHRRRRKRGGVVVRARAYLRSTRKNDPGFQHDSFLPTICPSLDLKRRWLLLIQPEAVIAVDQLRMPVEEFVPRRSQTAKRGVDLMNLRSLARAKPPHTQDTVLNLALINVRSLSNKTFMLNHFFRSRELDCMLLTETWVQPGELFPFSELLPPSCSFFSCPRTTGKGGGLATIFKSSLNCKKTPCNQYKSFELQLFELKLKLHGSVACALIYRPPKINKEFINDFSAFVAGIALTYNHFVIVGDFNIHVCCVLKPLVKDFLNILDSFNLT